QALLVDRSSVVPAATGDADGTEVVDEDEAITAPLELGGPGAELPALAVDPSFVPEGGVSDDPVEAVVRSGAEPAAVWFEATAGDADPPRHVVALGVEPVAVADGGILRPLLEQLAASPLLEPLTVTEALASAEPVDGWELVDAPSVPVGDLADRRAGL